MKYCLSILFFLSVTFATEAKDAPKKGLGYKPLTPERRKELQAVSSAKHGGRLRMLAQFQSLPAAFDCRDKGWVLPVGDQGNCGSCYLYSTVMTMTQAFVLAGYGKADGSFALAVQYGMDCQDFGGCDGGNGTEVVAWAMKNSWPAERWVDISGASHKDYPAYSASSQGCRKVPGAKEWRIGDWGFVAASGNRPATTLEIKTALFNYGPLNVALDAGGQFGGGTGTITSLGDSINHEIELVAYDDAKGAFLLKNQWGTDWGNGGYRWVTYAAAQSLVDVFFVTVNQLPPVPPDPTPPSPTSPDSVTIVVNQGGKITTTVIPLTPAGAIVWPSDTPQWLKDAVMGQKKKETQGAEPPLLPKPEAKKSAMIRVLCEPSAKIEIDGRPTLLTGAIRSFQTPPLPAGMCEYRFVVIGPSLRTTRSVSIRRGDDLTLDFRGS